jgi:hypothetical protein
MHMKVEEGDHRNVSELVYMMLTVLHTHGLDWRLHKFVKSTSRGDSSKSIIFFIPVNLSN